MNYIPGYIPGNNFLFFIKVLIKYYYVLLFLLNPKLATLGWTCFSSGETDNMICATIATPKERNSRKNQSEKDSNPNL